MAKVLFYTATSAQFDALQNKNENALYFLTDTGEFYKGSTRFSFPIQQVTDFPATGESGILYVKSNGETKLWTGTTYITVAGNLVDKFLSSVERHEVTVEEAGNGIFSETSAGDIGVLFTMNNGEKLFVRLTDFVDIYTADNSTAKGVTVNISGYKISAETKISATEGNQLSLNGDGLYAAPLEWQTI